MIKFIEKDINKEDYKLKINNNQIKILPANPDSYRNTLNANYHTYQRKQERPFRVVKLLKLGHEVTNISNIRHRISKNPLSLFFIDLKQKLNNKQIYNINRLINSVVKI